MEYTTLGRTGLKVSALGLGGGGHSRLGQRGGATAAESAAIVRRAIDLGVNVIDTAEAYGTEEIVGMGLRGVARDAFVLSTKKSLKAGDGLITADQLTRGLEASLGRLGLDYVDIYHLHAVRAEQYDQVLAELVPAMIKLREQGKIGFIGITEVFGSDTGHAMLTRALRDDCWDVMMVGFNILNQSARERVFAATIRQNIGVLDMFAVRDALSQPAKLREVVGELVEQGLIDHDVVDLDNPLGFVTQSGAAASMPEAAYRFVRAEPGVHVVLSGTGSPQHLADNVAAIARPPLPAELRQRLVDLFGRVDSVSGQ